MAVHSLKMVGELVVKRWAVGVCFLRGGGRCPRESGNDVSYFYLLLINALICRGEKCDDGNVFSGDGCNLHCDVEDYFLCEGKSEKITPVRI